MKRVMLFAVVFGVCSSALLAAEGRPLEPLVIADFESAESVGLWCDIAVSCTDAHASSGRQGMAFDIPKWIEERGDEPRPGARLLYQNGAGFPFTDWSGYGAVAVDVWADGSEEALLGIKLRDRTGTNSWTTHIELTPGRMYTAVLSMDDVAADIDPTDIQEVVLYSLRPKADFRITVDHLRLLPREKPPVARHVLTYPNYRRWIFPDGGAVEVAVEVAAGEYGYRARELAVRLRLEGEDGEAVERVARAVEGWQRVSIDAGGIGEGPVALTAEVIRRRGKRVLSRERWALEKLTPEAVAGLKVYVDRANNTIVDGEPFFPLGFYTNATAEQRAEVAASPFNTILIYGTNRTRKAEMRAQLDAIDSAGLKLIYCLNDVYPQAEYMKGKDWEGVTGNESITKAVVDAYKDHPALLAWYLNDEIPREQAPDLLDYYRRVKEADPNHPAFIVLCQKKDFAYLWETTDILSGDPYPIPKEPMTRVSDMVEKSKAPSLGSQPVWLVPQSFAWYQHNSKNPDRSHIPTEEELADGRAPNRNEARCMTYLGLVHGAKGLIYWCYYNMRMLPQYEEMWGWMQEIGQEVQTLAPVLLSPEDLGTVPFGPADAPVHTKLKRHEGRLYLMAVNAEPKACRVTFDLGRKLSSRVTVMFEDREVAVSGAGFADNFGPLEVHVYGLCEEKGG